MKFPMKALFLLVFAAAIWCQAAPVLWDIGCSARSIYQDWSYNRVIHDRLTVINANAGRTTWPDRLK